MNVLAFAAGLVASMNPCGFAMLPAYLSFLIGTGEQSESRPVAVARALRVALVVSLGFLLVFGAAGVALAAGARWITTAIPWLALLVGVVLGGVGLVVLSGRSLPVRLPAPARTVEGRGTGATAAFGVSYALASLSCTLPVFLVVIGGAGTQRSLAAGVATFGVYAAGMALPLLGVAVALALGNDALVRRFRGAARYTNRIAGGLLLVAGGYIVFYWATVLDPSDGGRAGDTLVAGVETLSARLTSAIGGNPMISGLVLMAVIAAAGAYVWLSRGATGAVDDPTDASGSTR